MTPAVLPRFIVKLPSNLDMRLEIAIDILRTVDFDLPELPCLRRSANILGSSESFNFCVYTNDSSDEDDEEDEDDDEEDDDDEALGRNADVGGGMGAIFSCITFRRATSTSSEFRLSSTLT